MTKPSIKDQNFNPPDGRFDHFWLRPRCFRTGCFLFCWTPFFVVHTMRALCVTCDIPPALMSTVTWLGYVNSALNPIIYTIFNTEFKKFFKKCFRSCCWHQIYLHRHQHGELKEWKRRMWFLVGFTIADSIQTVLKSTFCLICLGWASTFQISALKQRFSVQIFSCWRTLAIRSGWFMAFKYLWGTLGFIWSLSSTTT